MPARTRLRPHFAPVELAELAGTLPPGRRPASAAGYPTGRPPSTAESAVARTFGLDPAAVVDVARQLQRVADAAGASVEAVVDGLAAMEVTP